MKLYNIASQLCLHHLLTLQFSSTQACSRQASRLVDFLVGVLDDDVEETFACICICWVTSFNRNHTPQQSIPCSLVFSSCCIIRRCNILVTHGCQPRTTIPQKMLGKDSTGFFFLVSGIKDILSLEEQLRS